MTDRNLADLLQRQAERLGPKPAIRHKQHGMYRDLSWQDYAATSQAVAATLVQAGVQPGDRIGMWAENRLEWLLADMGILAAGAINVPAHASQAAKQVAEQFTHAEISWLFLANAKQRAELEPFLKGVSIRGCVFFDGPAGDDAMTWNASLTSTLQAGNAASDEVGRRMNTTTPEDLATIMYTSGTTGNSKGVMLTHGNLLSNAQSMLTSVGFTADSIVLSWLPFSHIYGRLVDHYLHLASGHLLALAESLDTLLDNLKEILPTSFCGVPRFYEKVLAACTVPDPAETQRKLRSIFGKRIQWLNSGGAPLPLHVAEVYQNAGLNMLQGYGLTESSPVISFNRLDSNRLGTVGGALDGVEIRIAADGEILTRGHHVMKGYWKNPEATAETIQDGWLCTGDLGQLDKDGYLSITGRKKDLLVLSNGKKVVPTHIEGLLLTEECIDQALVYGEGKNFLSALIVPNFDKVRKSLPSLNGMANAELVTQAAVYQLIDQRVRTALANVAHYEQVQKLILLPRQFSQEAEEMTVSLKLRRGTIFKKYQAQLDALYM